MLLLSLPFFSPAYNSFFAYFQGDCKVTYYVHCELLTEVCLFLYILSTRGPIGCESNRL